MAMVLQTPCDICNDFLSIYVPKKTLGELTGGDPELLKELAEIDAQEEADGEIEGAKAMASQFGSKFVDSRQGKVCPTCGATINFAEMFPQLRQN